MFTGIIQSIGIVISAKKKNGSTIITVDPCFKRRWRVGESIAISGVCSTIIEKKGRHLIVEYMPHTADMTTIAQWTPLTRVNIEPSLKVGDELSGHFVLGHVDGIAKITALKKIGSQYALSCRVPQSLNRYMTPKGSIALDGVSLTIGKIKQNSLTVFITPFTFSHTTFQHKSNGGFLNVEADMIAKHIHHCVCV